MLNQALRHVDVGSADVRLHLILTSPLDGDDWSVPRSDLSTPEETAPTPTMQEARGAVEPIEHLFCRTKLSRYTEVPRLQVT